MFDNVKILKYILIAILLVTVMIVPGELYQGYLDQYDDFYEITCYLPDEASGKAMLEELTEVAYKNDIYIFKICEKDHSIFLKDIDIYANAGMYEILENEYAITEGEHKSLFSGTTKIEYHDFFDISDELMKSDTKYYLYGDLQAMTGFKGDLEDKYAGISPTEQGFNDIDTYRSLLIVAWIFAIVVVVFITIYDAISQKKENFVRFTMGERVWQIVAKNILADTIYMVAVYVIVKLVFEIKQGSLVFEKYADIMFCVLLVINAVVFMGKSRIDYKLSTADMTSNSGVLKYNYIISAICMIILLISVTSCVEFVSSSYEYSKQEEYFEKYKDYNWYQGIRIEDESMDEQKLFNEFLAKNPEDFMYICQGLEIKEGSREFFYEASSGTREYLRSIIPELNKELTSEVYVLISDKKRISEEELSDIIDWADSDNYEIIYYSDSVELVYRIFDEDPITEIANNPVVLFYNNDNIDPSSDGLKYEFFLGMVNGSLAKWENFANENNIEYVETNAWDYYCYRWMSLSRTIVINVVIIAIMTFMYLLVSCMVIKMEFKVNAKELMIKKVYGYHIFERFRKLYGITAVMSVLSILVIIMLDLFILDINLVGMLGAILIIICIQYGFITCQIISYEKKNMQSILKGCNG